MAEGGVEEESGDMLGPAIAPLHQPSPAVNNVVKTEVSDYDPQLRRVSLISHRLCGTLWGLTRPLPCIMRVHSIICVNYRQ